MAITLSICIEYEYGWNCSILQFAFNMKQFHPEVIKTSAHPYEPNGPFQGHHKVGANNTNSSGLCHDQHHSTAAIPQINFHS